MYISENYPGILVYLYRFVVLRCRVEMTASEARKLVYSIEEQLTMKAVRFILVQR